MKSKQIIKLALALVIFFCGFLIAHKANAKELLTPDEIKGLHSVSKNVLVSRLIEQKRVEAEKQQLSGDLKKIQDTVSGLESSMRDELRRVSSEKKSGDDLLEEPLLDLAPSNTPPVSLNGQHDSHEDKDDIEQKEDDSESPKQSKSKARAENSSSFKDTRDKDARRKRISKDIDTAHLEASAERIKLEEDEAEYERQSNSNAKTDSQSSKKSKVEKKRLREKLLEAAVEMENELMAMKQTGADYKKVKELKKRFTLEKKHSEEKEIEPTIITINKHR